MTSSPAFDPALLEYLVCPETHQRLSAAPPELLASLRAQGAAGQLKNREGQPVAGDFEAVLVREDGQFAYLVSEGIPNMLVEEAVPLAHPTAG